MTTNILKDLLARVERWPQDAKQELVRSASEIESRYTKVYYVSADERRALERSAEDVRKGRFASDTEVEELFSRFHRP